MRSAGVRKEKDDKVIALKRRVATLARFDGVVVRLDCGPQLAFVKRVVDAKTIVGELRTHGRLRRATFERCVELASPLVALDANLIATAHRELRALAEPAALALARENRRALARYGTIDAAWLRAKGERVRGSELDDREEPWFARVVEVVRAARGHHEAAKVAEAGARIDARAAERRADAEARLAQLVACLAGGASTTRDGDLPSNDGKRESAEIARLAERIAAARLDPGRSRRRRALDVLRQVVGWPEAPASLGRALAHEGPYAARVRETGRAMIAALPERDPELRERALANLAVAALLFPIGDDGVAIPDDAHVAILLDLVPPPSKPPLALAKAVALAKLSMKRESRRKIAGWVAEGLDIDLVTLAATHADRLAEVPDARAARAYATWATRLETHYAKRGVAFSLPPELFTNLPRNEDLAVLAMCLMERVESEPEGDPIGVLDATLGLFGKLPAKASGILDRLRGSGRGEGRRLFPDFAAWIGEDALLDRAIHLARLAGDDILLPRAIRVDFEHAERARREREHLEALATRTTPQQGRLDALLRAERTLAGSPKGPTRRKLAERVDRLLPTAYRKELDATFREILREGWKIDVARLTPSWRDAVRFWLGVDDNRELLGRLLQEAAKAPGRDVKSAFPGNATWNFPGREAWCRPRRASIPGFELSLEEDPLEVLRMGIPFGTCLALDGVNAASTVLNAIDVNKRVLYVKNESGRIVARKLLAISKEGTLVGYHLYVSVKGDPELAIRRAVLTMCRAISEEAGAALASSGTPAQLHRGFWYDDGTVPFDEDVDVAAYCSAIGLRPPPEWFDEISDEARGFRARENGDIEAAIALLTNYESGPANRALGAWVVEHLGVRGAEKRAAEGDQAVFQALVRELAREGESGMVRALEISARLPERVTQRRLEHLLASFPPSPRLAAAIVDAGLRSLKRRSPGLGPMTLTALPAFLDDVGGALDVLDAIEPAWQRLRQTHADQVDAAERRAVDAVTAINAPDADVVTSALQSRHRSALAQRAALAVAARQRLPGGERAVARLQVLRPELTLRADFLAATLRQAAADRVSDSLARRVQIPTEAPFARLRDLLVSCAGLERVLGPHAMVDAIDEWTPGAWELAWRRRQADPSLRDALVERAARRPRFATRSMELLALLADVDRLGRLERRGTVVRAGPLSDRGTRSAIAHDAPLACRRTALSLAAQIATHHFDVVPKSESDAAYVDRAANALDDPQARRVVVACKDREVVDWQRVLGASAALGDAAFATEVLGRLASTELLSPRLVVDLWQRDEARAALTDHLAVSTRSHYAAHVWAAERDASTRGLSVEGLLERTALTLLAKEEPDDVIEVTTLDQLRSVVSAIVQDAEPNLVAMLYARLEDMLSVPVFLRAFARQPFARRAELREAVKKLELDGAKGKALEHWLMVSPER